ncbi:MAG: hypothetical protein ACKVTZ_12615 [Bacteroidia bacterium]
MHTETLFQTHTFLFWVPIGVAIALWLLSLLGVGHDTEAGHLHLDSDFHLGDFHLGNFEGFHIGKIPLLLIITLLLFTFGSIGLGLLEILSIFLPTTSAWTLSLLAAALAFFPAFFLSAFISRKLQPLFRDYGKATQAQELIGMSAIVDSNLVSDAFGSIRVNQKGNYEIELTARTLEKETTISAGKKVVIVKVDEEQNIYYVAEVEE